jgi:hypothetical protein
MIELYLKQKRIQSLEDKCADLINQNELLKIENELLNTKNDESLKTENLLLKTKIKKLNLGNELLKTEIIKLNLYKYIMNDITKQNDQMRCEIKTLRNEIEKLKKDTNNSKLENYALTSNLNLTIRQKDQMKYKIKTLEHELLKTKNELLNTENENRIMNTENKELIKNLRLGKYIMNGMLERNDFMICKIKTLENEFLKTKNELLNTENENKILKTKNKELIENLSLGKHIMNDMIEQKNHMTCEIKTLENEIEILKKNYIFIGYKKIILYDKIIHLPVINFYCKTFIYLLCLLLSLLLFRY